MSTASETPPEAVAPADPSKPPFYRRPLVLIIAGAVVVLLIVGGILTAVTLAGRHPAAHLVARATSQPKTISESTPTPTEAPSASPMPAASGPQPQAGPPAKSSGSVSAAAPAAPPAPPAPVSPPNAGPSRSNGPVITSFVVAPQVCPNGADGTLALVKVTWSYSGGDRMYLKDTYGELVGAGPNGFTESNNPGNVDFSIPCNGHDDPLTFRVIKSGAPATSSTRTGNIVPTS